jgi:hypothetical protein
MYLFWVKITWVFGPLPPTPTTTCRRMLGGAASNWSAPMVCVVLGIQWHPFTRFWVSDFVIKHNWFAAIIT